MKDCNVVAFVNDDSWIDCTRRIYSQDKLSPTVTACRGGHQEVKCDERTNETIRYRRLTENECFRLMGVKQADFDIVKQNQCKSSLYHLAGDSIVTTCLMAIFGELLDIDYETKIDELALEISKSTNKEK